MKRRAATVVFVAVLVLVCADVHVLRGHAKGGKVRVLDERVHDGRRETLVPPAARRRAQVQFSSAVWPSTIIASPVRSGN